MSFATQSILLFVYFLLKFEPFYTLHPFVAQGIISMFSAGYCRQTTPMSNQFTQHNFYISFKHVRLSVRQSDNFCCKTTPFSQLQPLRRRSFQIRHLHH